MAAAEVNDDNCSVPDGLFQILEEFTVEVFRKQPKNIYACIANYCEEKLRNGDTRFTTGDGVAEMNAGVGSESNKIDIGAYGARAEYNASVTQLDEQTQLLEKLRNDLCTSLGQDEPNSDLGVKERINSVLCQALDLVKTLEQMQGGQPAQCQGQPRGGQTNSSPSNMQTAPPVNLQNVSQEQPMSPEELCHQIHCLVKYIDQLSQQFDVYLGYPNCPYHHNNQSMPTCDQVMAYPAAPVTMVPVVVPIQYQVSVGTSAFPLNYGSNACLNQEGQTGAVDAESKAVGNTPSQDALFSELDEAVKQSGPVSVKSQNQPCSGTLAQNIRSFSQEIIQGACGDDMDILEVGAEWVSVIQDFLGDQLNVVQKLLSGEMKLSEAPTQVAFLTISFLLGVVAGYKLLFGSSTPSVQPVVISRDLSYYAATAGRYACQR